MNSRGMTLTEIIVTFGLSTIIIALMAAVMDWGSRSDNRNRAGANWAELRSVLRLSMMKDSECRPLLQAGVQTVNPNVNAITNVSLYNSDGTVRFFGTPTATQNIYGNTWRISNIAMRIVASSASTVPARVYRVGSLELTGAPLSPGASPIVEAIPVALTLSTGNPARILNCSLIDQLEWGAINAPNCAPGEKLVFVQPAAGQSPQWVCRPI